MAQNYWIANMVLLQRVAGQWPIYFDDFPLVPWISPPAR